MDDGDGIPPGSSLMPSDLARWARVQKVLSALGERGVSNVSEACRYTGVASSSFYNDIRQPDIVQKVAEWMQQVDQVAVATVAGRWVEVLSYQVEIACGDAGAPKDSTPAARFIYGVMQDARREMGKDEGIGESEAAQVLRKFKQRAKSVKARRVVEEVEVVSE